MIRRLLPPMIITLLALAALYLAVQPVSRPDDLAYAPLTFAVPVVEPVQLPNGIRLYLHEDHELPLIEITAMIGAGNIGDPADKTGLGDLFAALLEAGGAGEREPEAFAEYVERYAIDLSVGVDTYATVIEMSLLADDREIGIGVLDDLLRRPQFDSGRLEIVRNQMLEGIRRKSDLPAAIASRTFRQAVFGDHPFGREPDTQTVSALTRADLQAFHRRHFVPDNLYLAISGDFNAEDLRKSLESRFADWPVAGYQPDPLPPLSQPAQPAIWLAEKDVPQTTVQMGGVGIAKDNPDLQAVRVMNFILGGGSFNSRLMREIRSNRGLAYSVYSYYSVGRRLPGPFIASGETASATTGEMVRLMLAEMTRIRNVPVGDEELTLAKESLVNSFVFAFDDPHAVLTQKMRLDYYDYPPGYLETYRDQVNAVTVDDILRVAQTYLDPEQLAIVLVGRTAEFAADVEGLGRPVHLVKPAAFDPAGGGQ